MAEKHLKIKPHIEATDFKWYEDFDGISICIKRECRFIPWRSIRAALKRKDMK